MKTKIDAFIGRTVKGLELFMTCMLVVMMLTMFWQVFTRFVIKIPSIWTEEIARASFVYMAMTGAAVGVRRFSHFGMTLLSDKLEGRVRDRYFRYVLNAVILISSALILYYGLEFTRQYGFTRVSPTFLVPMAWLFVSMPIAGFFMVLFSLYNLLFEDYSAET